MENSIKTEIIENQSQPGTTKTGELNSKNESKKNQNNSIKVRRREGIKKQRKFKESKLAEELMLTKNIIFRDKLQIPVIIKLNNSNAEEIITYIENIKNSEDYYSYKPILSIQKDNIIQTVCEKLSNKAVINLFKYFELECITKASFQSNEDLWLKILISTRNDILPTEIRNNYRNVIKNSLKDISEAMGSEGLLDFICQD